MSIPNYHRLGITKKSVSMRISLERFKIILKILWILDTFFLDHNFDYNSYLVTDI